MWIGVEAYWEEMGAGAREWKSVERVDVWRDGLGEVEAGEGRVEGGME